MANLNIQLPDEFFERLEYFLNHAKLAADSAATSLKLAKDMVGDTSDAYVSLRHEQDNLRGLLNEIHERLHTLGNAINGKVGAQEVEVFIRQIVAEEIAKKNV